MAQTPSLTNLCPITHIRAQLQQLDLAAVEKPMLSLHQKFYGKGNKAHTMLARMLRVDRAFKAIKDGQGVDHSDPAKIATIFEEYYTQLYNLREPPYDNTDPNLIPHIQDYS